MMMFSSAAFRQIMASHPEFTKMMGVIRQRRNNSLPRWGYAPPDTASIQADNGAGLTKGIIGLTNHGVSLESRRTGCVAGVGLGRLARPRLSADGQRRGCEARWHPKVSLVMAKPRW
jgi:hypothetical protein